MHSTLSPSRAATPSADPMKVLDAEGGPLGSDAEQEFISAMLDYKRTSGRMFPTWSEVLEVARNLGYAKVANAV